HPGAYLHVPGLRSQRHSDEIVQTLLRLAPILDHAGRIEPYQRLAVTLELVFYRSSLFRRKSVRVEKDIEAGICWERPGGHVALKVNANRCSAALHCVSLSLQQPLNECRPLLNVWQTLLIHQD